MVKDINTGSKKRKKGGSWADRKRKDDKKEAPLLCFVVWDIRVDELTWCETSKDVFISIHILQINAGCVDDFDPRLVDANDFLHFPGSEALTLECQGRLLLYSSSIIYTSKRKILSASLYSEVKFAKLCSLKIQWITYGHVIVEIPSVSFASERSITSVMNIKLSHCLKRFKSTALVVPF